MWCNSFLRSFDTVPFFCYNSLKSAPIGLNKISSASYSGKKENILCTFNLTEPPGFMIKLFQKMFCMKMLQRTEKSTLKLVIMMNMVVR